MHAIAGQLKNSAHLLSSEMVTMINSLSFTEALRRADRDHDLRAFLMLEALKGIALDPLVGTTANLFYANHGAVTVFNIHFHRWINFIGWIELPTGSARAAQLIQAIEANVASKMFKAAMMDRRMNGRKQRLLHQAYVRAQEAYDAVKNQCGGQFETDADEQRAAIAFRTSFDPRSALIHDRVRRIAKAAMPEFVGAYSEGVAKFLYWHLPLH